MIDIDERFFRQSKNVLLIRNPEQLIASFAQVISNPTMDDIGVRKQFDLCRWLSEAVEKPVILDSGELLKDPPGVLTKFCKALGCRFTEQMLSWTPGPRPEDGIWAKHWYANVHASSGFQVQPTSSRALPDRLQPLLDEANPLYAAMFAESIKA
jgi:hypothetical protein